MTTLVLVLLAAAGARADDGFVPPRLVEEAAPRYPAEAAAAGLAATVILDIEVDERGAVTGVAVAQAAGHGFDEAAVAAARRFRYQPARRDGRAVPARVTYRCRFVLAEERAPAAATAVLRGRVLARGSRAPIAGAQVVATVAGGAPAIADTDGDGRFALDLAPGGYTVVVAGSGVERATFREELAAGATVTVAYFVDQPWSARYQTVVRAAPERVEVSHTLSTAELTRIPGTMGDALRAVENLPGVARAPFNSGLIIIRGGKPTDSRSFLAGSEIPQLYHFGGFTSIVPTHLIDSIEFFPGNFSARYGRATAGVIDVDLRAGRRDRLHGYVDTNAFDTGVGLEGPVGAGSFILGARRSYIDAVLRGAASVGGLDRAPLSFTTAPVYYDYQAVLDYPLAGGRLRAMAFGSDDDLRFLFNQPSSADPSLRGAFETHIFFHRLQLRWTRTVGKWSFLLQTSDGYNGQDGSLGSALNFSIQSVSSDERLEARWKASPRLTVIAGADTQAAVVFLDALLPAVPAEGELPLPIAASNKFRAHETLKVFNAGLYLEAIIRPIERLTITSGLRFDYYSPILHPSFNPRLNARLQLTRLTALRAGIGLYSQDPQPPDYDPVFGNPKLRPESAIHCSLSVEQAILPGLTLEVTGFYKQLYDLVVSSNRPIYTPEGRINLERKSNEGEGRIYGGELLLRQALSKWMFGWLSYTLMRSERRADANSPWRLYDFDQTHVLVLALSFNLPRGFGAGVRFRYVTGFPYTQPRGGEFDSDGGVYIPGVVTPNTARLDAYHALDVRLDKTFVFERWLLKVYLDVTNVYNHANPEQAQSSFDYTRQVAVTGLPIIPSFGVRGEF